MRHSPLRSALAFGILLASGAALAQSSATYNVTLDATWSAQTHPDGFPGNPHFSPLVGAVHNGSARLWEAGATASGGIEQMAETGGTSMLLSEIDAVGGGAILETIAAGAIGNSPGAASLNLTATEAHSLVTIVTMLAPSPDWFVGTESLDLLDGAGEWQTEIVVPMFAWDAGTDSGTGYTSSNADTTPREPIAQINAPPFVVGGALTPVGTMTFTLQTVVDAEVTPAPRTALRVWPQPMGRAGTVSILTAASGDATVHLYDVRGRRVRTLHDGPLASGETTLSLDARGLAAGAYLLRAVMPGDVLTRRVVITR